MKFRNYSNYEVFDDGRIWSYRKNRFLKPHTTTSGYKQVALTDNEGKMKWYSLHRVIYECVTGEPIPRGYDINHIDENKVNNVKSNLELLTHKENMNYGSRNQRARKALTNNPKRSKAVGAFDKNGKLVMTFPSTKEAGRNGFYGSHIADCCNLKAKTHKGFTWKYL